MTTAAADTQWLDEQAFQHSLARVSGLPSDPAIGLFGPDSLFWEVNRHALVYFLGAVQSVQLQLCHPWIATAVFEHSKIMSDPRQRARLTYRFLWSIIYGDRSTVIKRAAGLFKVHQRVQGTLGEDDSRFATGSDYAANEVNALLWVHVTAFWCRVKLYEQIVKPLSAADKDRFVQEAQRYAWCFGIPDSLHPATWAAVEAYIADTANSDTLASTRPGLTISQFLRQSTPRPLRNAVWTLFGVTLPARVSALLQLPEATPANLASSQRTLRWLRRVQRWLPDVLASVPAWHEANARLTGRQPSWIVRKLNQAILGVPTLV